MPEQTLDQDIRDEAAYAHKYNRTSLGFAELDEWARRAEALRFDPPVFRAIKEERARQMELWGEQEHPSSWWLVILQEEIGEACQEMLRGYAAPKPLTDELIQAAAVLVAWLEHRFRTENEAARDEATQ